MFHRIVNFIKSILMFLWLLAMLVLGGWIALYNSEPLSLNVFGLQLPEFNAGVYICVVLMLGVILGYITHYVVTQRKVIARKRALSKANKEVARLQSERIKGA